MKISPINCKYHNWYFLSILNAVTTSDMLTWFDLDDSELEEQIMGTKQYWINTKV